MLQWANGGAARWPDEMNFRAGVIRTQKEAQTMPGGTALRVQSGFRADGAPGEIQIFSILIDCIGGIDYTVNSL